MKKRNKLLLALTAFLASIFLVSSFQKNTFADMDGPHTFNVDYVVINKNGITADCYYYDQEKHEQINEEINIPYNTKLTGSYMWFNGTQDQNTKFQVMSYDNKQCTIKEQDVEYASKVFDFSTVTENTNNPLTQYIVSDESYLYKGPDESYGKVDNDYHLPKGIVVTATYYDGLWMYVEYEGHNGWIYHNNIFNKNAKTANIATSEWDRSFVTTRNKIELKESPHEDEKVVTTLEVSPLTEIPVLYYIPTSKFTSEVYIVYGQYSGWYTKKSSTFDIALRNEDSYRENGMTVKEKKVSKLVDADSEVQIIPANVEYRIAYTASNGLYESSEYKMYIVASYDNKTVEGWTDYEDCASSSYNFQTNQYTETTLEYDQPIFDSVNGKETGEIAKKGTYKILYHYTINDKDAEDEDNNNDKDEKETWYYIAKEGAYGSREKLGWIKSLNDDEVKELKKQKKAKEKETIERIENKEPEDLVTYKIPDEPDPKAKSASAITWFLLGAVILSASIITTLAVAKHIKKLKEAEESDPDSEKDDDEDELDSEEKDDENSLDSEESDRENKPNSEENDDENDLNSEDIDEEIKPKEDEKPEDNSKNREENEKNKEEDLKKDDDEIEEKLDEFLSEDSSNSEETLSDSGPNSEKTSSKTKAKTKKSDVKADRKGEKDA